MTADGPAPASPDRAAPSLPPAAPSRVSERLGLAAVTLVLAIPFLDKPFHIDDPFFLALARQIATRPLDPLGFHFYWHDTAQPVTELVTNPPGLGYLLAPLIALFGESERVLHTLFLVFPLLAVQSLYDIARRFSPHPVRVALLVAAAPMFTVSASSLMADVPALACMLAWFALLLAAIDGRRGAGILAGLMGAAAVFIKYTTVVFLPVAALAVLLFARSPRRHLVALLLPLLVLLAWEGSGLLGEEGSGLLHTVSWSHALRAGLSEKLAATSSFLFLGAGAAPLLLAARLRSRAAWLALAAGAACALALLGPAAPEGLAQVARARGVAPATAVAVGLGIAWLSLTVRDGFPLRPRSVFLLAWLGAALLQVIVVASFVAARYLLPALPAALLLWRPPGKALTAACLAISMLLSYAVGRADLDLAKGYQLAAGQVRARHGAREGRLRFQGHWGFQYYMERYGVPALYVEQIPKLAIGDRVAIPREGANVISRPGLLRRWDGRRVVPAGRVYLLASFPVTVMSRVNGAGLYSSRRGLLPFSWGEEILEQIDVLAIAPEEAPGR